MLGFIRGYDNTNQFADIGCNVWDANANDNDEWRRNPHRRGPGDLGKIYGQRWRNWENWLPVWPVESEASPGIQECAKTTVDQLGNVIKKLESGIDDRRLIVEGWHPAELHLQALPVCHKSMQFNLSGSAVKTGPNMPEGQGRVLSLFVHIRSSDVALGLPYNIAGYAFLLTLIAQITGHRPGVLHFFLGNVHIYKNHVEALLNQLNRVERELPTMSIDPRCHDLKFIEQTTLPLETWTHLEGYNPHPAIFYEMAV